MVFGNIQLQGTFCYFMVYEWSVASNFRLEVQVFFVDNQVGCEVTFENVCC
jgi:hypothetical protein